MLEFQSFFRMFLLKSLNRRNNLIFHVNQICDTKFKLGVNGLLELIEDKTALDLAIKQDGKCKSQKECAKLIIEINRCTNNGVVQQHAPIETLRKKSKILEDYISICTSCPANCFNPTDKAFGCFGRIEFPIKAEAEAIVMDLVRDILNMGINCLAARPLKYILENNITGDGMAGLRKQKGLYFENTKQIVATHGHIFKRQNISSNQIFELLLGAKILTPKGVNIFEGFIAEMENFLPQEVLTCDFFIDIYNFFKSMEIARKLNVDIYLFG